MCDDSGYCWVIGPQQLFIWRYQESRDARLRALTLPREVQQAAAASSNGAPLMWVSILPQAGGGTTVLLCTESGIMAVWLDTVYLAGATLQHILPSNRSTASSPALLTSFAATLLSHDGGGPAFAAVATASDGSWYLLHGGTGSSNVGMRRLNVPGAAAGAGNGGSGGGLLGRLGSVVSWGYGEVFDPLRKFMHKAPSNRPALSASLAAAPGCAPGQLRVLLLTEQSVDCWLVRGMRQWRAVRGLCGG